jgi:hypothetical protein
MKLYANSEGYLLVHVNARQDAQEEVEDVRVKLDCAADQVVTYPLHLRVGASPTAEMPAPERTVPMPKNARILPALTDADARQLSDSDLIKLGYPPRPPAASPNNYAQWLQLVSRPITLLPPDSVSRPDISHSKGGVQAGPSLGCLPGLPCARPSTSPSWSGLEAKAANGTYYSVQGYWQVPSVGADGHCHWGSSGAVGCDTDLSAFWVGLDGDNTVDLVQAGTEQQYDEIQPGMGFAAYDAFTEVVPNEGVTQPLNFKPSPGDNMFVGVWIGDVNGYINPNGTYAWFYVYDVSQSNAIQCRTPLNGIYFNGSEAEWIMERPKNLNNGSYFDLANYQSAQMSEAGVQQVLDRTANTFQFWPAGAVVTNNVSMYNGTDLLSEVSSFSDSSINFKWVSDN